MLERLRNRSIHQSWVITLLLFALIAVIHFVAAYLKSLTLNFMGLALYALVPLVFVKSEQWAEIRLRKPVRLVSVIVGLLGAGFFVGISYIFLSWWVGFSSVNFMVLMTKQQMSYGVITPANAWQYFPIAALGYSSLSPLTEELFFRGVLLKAFETKFSRFWANVFQALLFGFIHLAYFWLIEFNLALVYTMMPFIAIAGALYGWVAQQTESVWASAIVHGFLNFLLILVVYAFLIPRIG
jgi:membrane protease YdiL (CAAX protease family)